MPAGLTVGLLLWAAMGAHGPARTVRLDAGVRVIRATALRQVASHSQAPRELSAGLRALQALLPHGLLLSLPCLTGGVLRVPQPGGQWVVRETPGQLPRGATPWSEARPRAP